MLSNIHSEFEGVGTSVIDLSGGLFSGRISWYILTGACLLFCILNKGPSQ